MNQMLILLVGNIGTGKSTWVKNFMSQSHNREYVVIDNDSLSTMLAGVGRYQYDEAKIALYSTLKQKIIDTCLKSGYSVVIDGTHISKKYRRPYLQLAKKYKSEILVLDFGRGNQQTLESRCRAARGISRCQWERVHKRYFKLYERPSEVEGIFPIVRY